MEIKYDSLTITLKDNSIGAFLEFYSLPFITEPEHLPEELGAWFNRELIAIEDAEGQQRTDLNMDYEAFANAWLESAGSALTSQIALTLHSMAALYGLPPSDIMQLPLTDYVVYLEAMKQEMSNDDAE